MPLLAVDIQQALQLHLEIMARLAARSNRPAGDLRDGPFDLAPSIHLTLMLSLLYIENDIILQYDDTTTENRCQLSLSSGLRGVYPGSSWSGLLKRLLVVGRTVEAILRKSLAGRSSRSAAPGAAFCVSQQ